MTSLTTRLITILKIPIINKIKSLLILISGYSLEIVARIDATVFRNCCRLDNGVRANTPGIVKNDVFELPSNGDLYEQVAPLINRLHLR